MLSLALVPLTTAPLGYLVRPSMTTRMFWPSWVGPQWSVYCLDPGSLTPVSPMPSFLSPPLASAWFCLTPMSSFLMPLFASALFCSSPRVSALRSLFSWTSLPSVFLALAWWKSSYRLLCLLLF